MIIDLPKLGPVNFDDKLTPDQFQAELERLSKKYEFEIPKSELTYGEQASRALTRGTKQLGSTFGDIIPAMVGSAIGADEYAAKQMGEAKATQEEIDKYYAPQYKQLSDVKGVTDVPGFALETFLENIPNILTSLIPGVGAEAIAAKTAASGIMKQAAIEGAKKGLAGDALEAFAINRLETSAPQIAAKGQTAQNAGIFLGSYAQNAPEVFQNIYDKTGQMETGASLLWGSASAALDSVLPAQLLKSITGPVKVGIVEKILEQSGMDKGLTHSIAANVLKDAGYEGLTEGAQEAISISAEKFIGNNPQVFDSDDWKRIVESSVRGAVAGGPLGGVAGAAETAKAGRERQEKYGEALLRREERQRASQLKADAAAAGVSIDEYQASKAQGELPGMETGAYSSLLPPKVEETAKTSALKELKGKQSTLFDENGVPTKAAELAKTKGDKAEANRIRQAEQKEKAALKESQAKLKKFLAAKQGTLDLQAAPPTGGVADETQLDLFGAQPVAEPVKVAKPQAATPTSLGTVIGKDKQSLTSFGKALGIGHSASILKADGPLAGKDLSNPADAAEVRRILEAYASGKPAAGATAKIEEFLKRPEFAAQPQETQDGTRTGPVAGTRESGIPSTGETVSDQGLAGGAGEPNVAGVGVPGQTIESTTAGEGAVEPALKAKEVKDLAKAEAAVEPAVQEKQDFVRQIEDNVGERLMNMLPEGVDFSWLRDSDAYKYFRIAPLIQEYRRLKEVLAKAIDSNQKRKNAKELEVIRNAILESGPVASQIVKNLDADPNNAQAYIDAANKAGRDEFEKGVREQQAKNKPVEATATPVNVGLDQEIQAENVYQKFVATNIAKAIKSGKVDNLIDVAIESETNPEVKAILEKVKKMKLKTKVKIGKPTGGLLAKIFGFHGSPSDFKFFDDKYATAGVQGWGHYLGKKRGTAEEYTGPDGHLYEVDSNVDTKYLLKLDKSLLDQSPQVLEALKKFGAIDNVDYPTVLFGRKVSPTSSLTNGETVYSDLADALGSQEAASKALNEIGILGAVYRHTDVLDKANKGTAYLIYDAKNLNITNRLYSEQKTGSYDPATDTIVLDPKLGLTTHTSVHELVHAAISHVLRNPNHPLTKQLTAIYEGIYNQLGSSYGATDIQEFAAELIGNPAFREALKGIKAPKGGNMLQRIIQHLAEFFGFREGQSAYDAAIKAINDIMDVAPGEPKSTGEQLFNVYNDAREAMPALTAQAIESAKNTFSNLQGMDYKVAGLSVMRLDQINKIWGKQLPSIQTLLDSLEKRKGFIETQIKDIKNKYNRFLNLAKKESAAFNRMQNMAYDARLEKAGRIDQAFKYIPIPPKASPKQIADINKQNAERKAAYDKHRAVYNQLPDSVKAAYTSILNDYKKSFDQYKDILINSTDSLSLKQKIKAKFEAVEHIDGYIPFLRRGDYWVRYADPTTGEEAASAFESKRERDIFVKQVLKGAEHTLYQNLESARFNPNAIPPTNFIHQVISGMEGASREQIDSVYQAYLALFPAESISKQFMHSKNIRGMEIDIVRGYADTMLKWSRKLGDSIYAPAIDRAVNGVKTEAENAKDDTLYAVARNIESQSAFYHNPTFNNFVHGATALSYFEYISGNLSSALVNLTSLPLLVLPMLGGRFGFTKTSSAMLAAHKVASDWVMKNNNINPRYKALYDILQDHAQLEHTMARELLEGRRTTTGKAFGLKAKVLDGLSIPFSATEKYNRAVTAIAAYDLAKANGFSEEKALRLALDTVKDAHTSGMAETAPKWMQNPLGRVFFTFKSFAWNSAFIVARSFEQGFISQTKIMKEAKARGDMQAYNEAKAIRDAARRQLLGTFFMAGMFGGVKALPFMGLAQTIGQMLHALFGDDEPYDFNQDMRAFFGELIYKGPVNFATNLEISNRVGIAQDLIWRDDPRASSGFVLGAMQRAFGPAGSYLVNVEHAYDMFNQGHTERAIEAVMPSFARNGMKGARYMLEGANTLKGDPIEGDVGAYNSLMQVIGFSPASLSSKYEVTSAAKSFEKAVKDKRQQLLDKYEMGRVGRDSDLMSEAKEDIAKFNEAHPKDRITGETLTRSQAARKAAEKNTIYGVTFNKHLMPEIREKFFNEG